MDNLSFGMVMTIVGMCGTVVSLWLLTLLMTALKKAFPVKTEAEGGNGK